MHKLDRAAVSPPACLTAYSHTTHTWADVTSNDKEQIRVHLNSLQGRRCAYCEGSLDEFGQHVEHFRRKNPAHFPQLTFAWSNLFWSCDADIHCGHYKDRPSAPSYDPNNVIKPDDHDPDRFFYFHSLGEVRMRPHLSSQDETMASETVRVFNLNAPELMASRRRALKIYSDRNLGMLEVLMSCSEEERAAFVKDEIEATKYDPHWTVIRHFFEKVH